MVQRRDGINNWAARHNALFGPAKYQLLDTSRKRVPHVFMLRKKVPLPRFGLVLGQHTIKSSTSVKLLGIHLDRELRWQEQSSAALQKGHAWLTRCGRLVRASRGITANPMRRLYLGACVPAMLYGADLFLSPPSIGAYGSKRRERGVIKHIRTIQRRAALAITGALASTPTDTLDVYAGLLPVVHLVEKLCYGAALHLAALPTTHPLYDEVRDATHRRPRHPSPLHDLIADFSLRPRETEKIAAVRMKPGWESRMQVVIPRSKEAAMVAEEADNAEWKVYTDGSGIDGRVGSLGGMWR
ncbi:hypothetical protein C8R43DRAFT_893161 [Mycena crocata]|nr:hypothetical protein C8R43DRAFT_893161 [Mycena crocata]